jgi:hypothetical protein
MALRWTAAGMLEAERQLRRSSATGTSPPSSSRSNTTTTGAVTHPAIDDKSGRLAWNRPLA